METMKKWTLLAIILLSFSVTAGVNNAHAQNSEEFEATRILAEQGDADAQLHLGSMYADGQGVEQDYSKTVEWYRKSANQGYALAHFLLGLMHTNAESVTQDAVIAHMWFSISVASGGEAAAEYRDKTAKEMTAEQIAKAEELTAKCMESHFKDCP